MGALSPRFQRFKSHDNLTDMTYVAF